jgi:hypothetical protein
MLDFTVKYDPKNPKFMGGPEKSRAEIGKRKPLPKKRSDNIRGFYSESFTKPTTSKTFDNFEEYWLTMINFISNVVGAENPFTYMDCKLYFSQIEKNNESLINKCLRMLSATYSIALNKGVYYSRRHTGEPNELVPMLVITTAHPEDCESTTQIIDDDVDYTNKYFLYTYDE